MASETQAPRKTFIKRRTRRRKVCYFCVNKIEVLDYKAVGTFKKFITDRGKIVPKRNSGVCAKHQRLLSNTIKRSRLMGFIPFTVD